MKGKRKEMKEWTKEKIGKEKSEKEGEKEEKN
jgi:hypothetical protein